MRPELYLGAAAAALLLASTAAHAAETPAPVADTDPTQLGDVVVTANRSAQAADRVGQSVTVLTTEAITAGQAVSVADLLVRTPGVSLSRNGGVGASTALRIRGAESDHTVVVIDGVKLNDPSSTGGGFNFGSLLVNDIARIEVLRGAQSTLWGSQAIGGVVNIVTAQPSESFSATLDAEAGSRGTQYLRGGIGGASERLIWRLAASHYNTDGFSTAAVGTEKDGYENTGLSGRADIKLTEDVSIDLRAVYSDGTVDIDGFLSVPPYTLGDTRDYARTKELVTYAGLNFDLFDDRLSNRIAYGYTRTKRDNFNPDQAVTTVTFDAEGTNERYEYQGVFDIREGWTATFGAEHEDSEFSTASPSEFDANPTPSANKVGIDGVYLQVQGEVIDGLTLTGGVRRDEHDTFGGKTLGQAAAAWSLNGGNTVLRASFGQGFKAPSLYQLYSEGGNLDLQPEEADGWDSGVEQWLFDRRLTLSATYFDRETTNQIDWVNCDSPSTDPLCTIDGLPRLFGGYYGNTAKTSANGVELGAAAWLGPLSMSANYTFTDTENESPGDNFGRDLARRPEETANLSASWVWPFGLTTGVAVQYVGDSFDNASNSNRLDGYTLVDLRVSYPIDDNLELYGRVENVGDETYQTTRNYGSAGRGTFVGVRARF